MVFNAVATWFALAIGVEFMIDILKQAFPFLNTKVAGIDNERVMAILIGFLICYGSGLDFFELFGIPYTLPFVGYILGAILIAGGSAKMHDLVKAIGSTNTTI